MENKLVSDNQKNFAVEIKDISAIIKAAALEIEGGPDLEPTWAGLEHCNN